MKCGKWQAILLIILAFLLASCNQANSISVQSLCPSGPGGSWVVIQPESLEFFPLNVDPGTLTEFRLLAVATDGQPPDNITSCAAAYLYPRDENLPVHATYRNNEKYYETSRHGEYEFPRHALVLDDRVLGEDKIYVYFVGIDAGLSTQEMNDAVGPAVYAIRQGIHEAITMPDTGDLAQDVTNYVLTNYANMIHESDIVDYGAFAINPRDWRVGGLHMAYTNHMAMSWRYQLFWFNNNPDPALNRLQPTMNVIKNGDFESWWHPDDGTAAYWFPYGQGKGHVAWYRERWDEAVYTGKQSQLMEIGLIEQGAHNVIVAVYQTTTVVPNSTYELSFQALMRSDAPTELLNTDEYEMYWGVDYSGRGDYDNVADWVPIPLEEQPRTGSNRYRQEQNTYKTLKFELARGRVFVTNQNQISLFIRGIKRNATGIEVNFNVDNVALVGPSPEYQMSPTRVPPPEEEEVTEGEPTVVPFTFDTPEAKGPLEQPSEKCDCVEYKDEEDPRNLDCPPRSDDFETWDDAKACYDYCIQETDKDVYGLDGNNDGEICE